MSGTSVERVRAALLAAGHPDTIRAFPEGTRSAVEAAAAVGCAVAQIAKSIVFRGVPDPADPSRDRAVLVVASGANRVNPAKAACAGRMALRRADAAWVREATGFAIGGVAPLGHLAPPVVLVDRDLAAFDSLWAAAGSPTHVFATTPDELLRISGGAWAVVREG
ncbi:YbaK/EbsC family protein [Craurococcus roseus]|uniref:YbaK/EbsC family protein n=1 Tax=Craurococcus roseus TaxID=77585 RepID=A0ABN1FEM7_9PROT